MDAAAGHADEETGVRAGVCLYLNVYAPDSPPPKGGRAVMFWIYGGGLYFGDASMAAYDGSHFAAYEDVVIVAANYRTNGRSSLLRRFQD